MGDEKLFSSTHHRRYGSQPISVPFLWEQKPGMPKRDWTANSIPFVAAKSSSSETAILPLKLVISVPFQWEEKPGKPLVPILDESLCSIILPAANSCWNPSINERNCHSDSSSSAMQNELEVKSCNRNCNHIVKRRTMTLGQLILLSRNLSYPRNAVFVREHRFFSMELIRRGTFACFPFRTNHQKESNVVL